MDTQNVDLVKWVGVGSAVFMGARNLLRFVRAYRSMGRPGLTIHNGTLTEFQHALNRIERRQDEQARTLNRISQRVESVENRLSA